MCDIKQELLDSLDKLIRHSQVEAQSLKHALENLKQSGSPHSDPIKELGGGMIKQELLDNPAVSPQGYGYDDDNISQVSSETMCAARTLIRFKEEYSPHQPLAKRPRIDLGPGFDSCSLDPGPHFDSYSPAAGPSEEPTPINVPVSSSSSPGEAGPIYLPASASNSTPMVLVPIPAETVRELLLKGGTIPPMSLLSALPVSAVQPGEDPGLLSPGLLSSSLSSSILRFCERRSARDAVDVFHYLPADARTSPFPGKSSTGRPEQPTTIKPPSLPATYTPALPTTPIAKLHVPLNERTIYTPFQQDFLERSFGDNEFLTKGQREELSRELLIHPGRIKVWYQNRRAKKRREDQLRERIEAAARTGSTVVAD